MRLHRTATVAVTGITAMALLVAACGDTSYGDASEPTRGATNPTATSAPRTPAATAPAPSETANASPATPSATVAPAHATQLTLVASGIRFDRSALTAPAGEVTIIFENGDAGVPHNLHVFRGSDASGDPVGATEIAAGAGQQELALGELEPGSYFFQCDVHPSQMNGTLTVN